MISTLAWVQRGMARQQPERYQLTDEEFERIQKLSAAQLLDARQDLIDAQDEEKEIAEAAQVENKTEIEDDEEDAKVRQEYDLDNYDTADDEEAMEQTMLENQGLPDC